MGGRHPPHVWTREGWVYLAVIIDLFSRRVIGWAISNRQKQDLAIRVLNMAIALRSPPFGCIHQSNSQKIVASSRVV